MELFISKLNDEQLRLLNEIKRDFREMETVDLYEFLTEYFQEQGLEDIDNNPRQLLLESIIDLLAEISNYE